MADTYLTWWTSIETDLRKSLVINAMRDRGAMHSLIRTAFEAGLSSAAPPSPSTAPEMGERAEFEAWAETTDNLPTYQADEASYAVRALRWAESAFKAGRALAYLPAEVDDEGLPPLPDPEHEFWDYHRQQHIRTGGYTPQQFRQGQRDAVAADRARREKGGA